MDPVVTFVVAARNDNYGGNFLHRMQVFTNVLLELWDKHGLDAELIIVEWNPPEERPCLKDALTWPKCLKPGTVRIIKVPGSIHRRLPNSDRMPMFEYIAKNVGIRRAKGEYVLATNPDLLFSEELIGYLASKKLSGPRFYRIDRCDFRGAVSVGAVPEAALNAAKRQVDQLNTRQKHPRRLRVLINPLSRFLEAASNVVKRQVDQLNIRREYRALHIPIGPLRRSYSLLSGKWPGSHKKREATRSRMEPVIALDDDTGIYGGIYSNASGDFILASLDDWRKIRGFPEFTDTYTHLDSYACHQLKALGLEQALFLPPCMIFHADHDRIEQRARPKVPSDSWQGDLRRIRTGDLGPALNDENWGLGDEEFSEMR